MSKGEIIRLKSVSQFNSERGQTTLHPLVTVLDQSHSSKLQSTKWLSDLYIVFLKDSKCSDIKYGRHHYDYEGGTMMFVAPGQVMGIEEEGLYQPNGWALAFHPDLIHGMSLDSHMKNYNFFSYHAYEALHLSEKENLNMLQCFEKIADELKSSIDKHSKKLIVSNIELLLNYCLRYYDRQFVTREHVCKDILTRFEKLLNNYYQSEKPACLGLPTVTYCATELHLSSNYFGDLIKKETGKTAQEFIQQKVIDLAKSKVMDTHLSISEIAYAVGFSYPQHFTRLFKQHTGMTPSEYRNLN